jgi:hypothetical protein
MSRRLIFVIAAELFLGGCCREPGRFIEPPVNAMSGWNVPYRNSYAPLPKRHHAKRVVVRKVSEAPAVDDASPTEQDLAKLRPYSKEWGAALDAMNRAADEKLRRKLIICRGCMLPEPDSQTGSITSEK